MRGKVLNWKSIFIFLIIIHVGFFWALFPMSYIAFAPLFSTREDIEWLLVVQGYRWTDIFTYTLLICDLIVVVSYIKIQQPKGRAKIISYITMIFFFILCALLIRVFHVVFFTPPLHLPPPDP
jgi:hypothetical protein